MAGFPEVIQQRDSDSDGYQRYWLSDPVGQAGVGVAVDVGIEGWDKPYRIILHGQTVVDVPGVASSWTVAGTETETSAQE